MRTCNDPRAWPRMLTLLIAALAGSSRLAAADPPSYFDNPNPAELPGIELPAGVVIDAKRGMLLTLGTLQGVAALGAYQLIPYANPQSVGRTRGPKSPPVYGLANAQAPMVAWNKYAIFYPVSVYPDAQPDMYKRGKIAMTGSYQFEVPLAEYRALGGGDPVVSGYYPNVYSAVQAYWLMRSLPSTFDIQGSLNSDFEVEATAEYCQRLEILCQVLPVVRTTLAYSDYGFFSQQFALNAGDDLLWLVPATKAGAAIRGVYAAAEVGINADDLYNAANDQQRTQALIGIGMGLFDGMNAIRQARPGANFTAPIRAPEAVAFSNLCGDTPTPPLPAAIRQRLPASRPSVSTVLPDPSTFSVKVSIPKIPVNSLPDPRNYLAQRIAALPAAEAEAIKAWPGYQMINDTTLTPVVQWDWSAPVTSGGSFRLVKQANGDFVPTIDLNPNVASFSLFLALRNAFHESVHAKSYASLRMRAKYGLTTLDAGGNFLAEAEFTSLNVQTIANTEGMAWRLTASQDAKLLKIMNVSAVEQQFLVRENAIYGVYTDTALSARARYLRINQYVYNYPESFCPGFIQYFQGIWAIMKQEVDAGNFAEVAGCHGSSIWEFLSD
jgi:hypothetical protein